MDIPLVSIIIPTYNYGQYLAGAIESALKQTYPRIEIIVVNDGSTDNTREVAKQYPVRYYYQKNQGRATAVNNGVKRSLGEFFLCLDADDKLAPNYVAKTIEQIMKNHKIGFVCTGCKVWDEETGIEDIWIPHKVFSKYGLFAGWEGVLGPSLIRREAFDSLDYGFDVNMPFHTDLELCFRLLLKGWKMSIVQDPIYWYRRHRGSINSELRRDREKLERIFQSYMNRKYHWIELYKRFYSLYQSTFGRAVILMMHPIAYFRGIRRKVKANMLIKYLYKRANVQKLKNVQRYIQEISLTIDRQIKWSWNQKLRSYYEKRYKVLESRLKNSL
jgi:glycosyltransferase involved in cell wall biosynthesis